MSIAAKKAWQTKRRNKKLESAKINPAKYVRLFIEADTEILVKKTAKTTYISKNKLSIQ